MEIKSRLPDIGTTIFTVMSRMAQEEGAINLSQGYPDYNVSEELIGLIRRKMEEGHNQYAPMAGVPILRKVISDIIEQTYGRKTNPETEVTITAGGTEAIFSTVAALVNPGDEVIMFDPSYDSYDPSVRLNGGIPVHLSLRPPFFSIDWDEVNAVITSRTRMIMINTPHNPVGAVLREKDLKILEQLADRHGLFVLSDEVYERIIFDGLKHQSVLKFPGLASRSIAIFSFGKTFHATGWKIGYAVASEPVTREIRRAHQFITFSVNTPIQLALAQFMLNPDNYLHLGEFFQKKRDYFLDFLRRSPFIPQTCHGSYFQLVSYKGFSDKTDTEMAEWLTREHKVACIPVSVFYKKPVQDHLLRFCFAKEEGTLRKAGEILGKLA